MKKATEAQFNELHNLVTLEFLKRVKSGEASAQELKAACDWLKTNDITGAAFEGSALDKLRHVMPQVDPELVRGVVAVRAESPGMQESLALEKADHHIRIPDVDCQQHAVRSPDLPIPTKSPMTRSCARHRRGLVPCPLPSRGSRHRRDPHRLPFPPTRLSHRVLQSGRDSPPF